MNRFPHDHPVWRILTMCVVLGFLTLILWVNASNFDRTELTSILEMAIAIGGWEFARSKMEK
jgi:hypothetical protein